MIEILRPGVLATVQDLGRSSFLSIGVGSSGAMDPLAFRLGNLLLGNAPGAAGIEFTIGGFAIRFKADTAFALTGADCEAVLDDAPVPPWWCMAARAGQVLRGKHARHGMRAYFALAGGLDVPAVLGSASTDLKGGFGGLDGRALAAGDRIGTGGAEPKATPRRADFGIAFEEVFGTLVGSEGEIGLRVIPGPEHFELTPEAQERFWDAAWTISPDSNRIGYRLSGPALDMGRRVELLSHGIVPGVVQLPPSGQPIIQLSDANTCGGYPKPGTVIAADLWRLGQARLGGRLRFRRTSRDEAVSALAEQNRLLDSLVRDIETTRRMLG